MPEIITELLFPLHPKFVHFPIALMCAALLFEVISRMIKNESTHKAAVICYITAALSSIVTVLTGLFEANRLHLHHPVLDKHQICAYIFSGVSLASLFLFKWIRVKDPLKFRQIFLALAFFLACVALTASYFGGKMVYQYGVGVSS